MTTDTIPTTTATSITDEPAVVVNKGNRSIKFEWVIREEEAHEGDEKVLHLAVLSVFSHHPNRKVFSASLNREVETKGSGPFVSRACWPFDAVRIVSVPGPARFSMPALIEAADAALVAARAAAIEGPQAEAIASMFDPERGDESLL